MDEKQTEAFMWAVDGDVVRCIVSPYLPVVDEDKQPCFFSLKFLGALTVHPDNLSYLENLVAKQLGLKLLVII